MATAPKSTGTGTVTKSAAQNAFDAFEGDEVFANRPIINFDKLGSEAAPVIGLLVDCEELALPKGAVRMTATGEKLESWPAYVIHLTQPTKAKDKDDNIVDVIAGREVYIGRNPNNSKRLDARLNQVNEAGQPIIFEVAIKGGQPVKVGAGKNDMHGFDIKVGKSEVRKGAFLLSSGPQTRQLEVGSNLANEISQMESVVNGTAAAHAGA